jgi:hypothetical protein
MFFLLADPKQQTALCMLGLTLALLFWCKEPV